MYGLNSHLIAECVSCVYLAAPAALQLKLGKLQTVESA